MAQQLQSKLPQKAIADFFQRWQIKEFYVFGSVLRADFCPDSDQVIKRNIPELLTMITPLLPNQDD